MSDRSIVPSGQPSDNFQTFKFHNIPVQGFLNENGEPIILAGGVCKALGLSDVSRAVSRLDDDEKGTTLARTPGGAQQVLTVTESGLYTLVLRSDKPDAKAFKRWITHEVLPTIRNTGSYTLKSMTPVEQFKALVAYMEQTQAQIEEIHEKLGENSLAIEQVVDRLDDSEYLTVKQFCQRQRINVTTPVRASWGKLAGELSRARGSAIYSAVEDGYSVGRYHEGVLLDVCRPKPKVSSRQLNLPEEK